MFDITLPESKKRHPIKSLSRPQVREQEGLVKDLVSGKIMPTEYQDKILGMAYPGLAKEEIESWPGADIAHLVRVTVDYSTGGPSSVKNFLRSGDGTATA